MYIMHLRLGLNSGQLRGLLEKGGQLSLHGQQTITQLCVFQHKLSVSFLIVANKHLVHLLFLSEHMGHTTVSTLAPALEI